MSMRSSRASLVAVSLVAVSLLAALACGTEGAPARPPAPASAGTGGATAPTPPTASERAGGVDAAPAPDPVAEVVRAPAMDGDVALIDVTEVREKLERGAPMLLVDTRGRSEFEHEHIPGAVNVPLTKIAAAGALPAVARDYEIVVYCSTATCPISREAARALATLGYTNVKDMRDGLVGWKKAGFATVGRRG